jgi:hypothetical protein
VSARVGTALSDGASAVGTMCGPMKASFARLFQRAQAEVPRQCVTGLAVG